MSYVKKTQLLEEEIYLYCIEHEKAVKSGQTLSQYCEERGLNATRMRSINNLMNYCRANNPLKYSKMMKHVKEYQAGEYVSQTQYSLEHSLSKFEFNKAIVHVRYNAIVEKFKQLPEEERPKLTTPEDKPWSQGIPGGPNPMSFIPVRSEKLAQIQSNMFTRSESESEVIPEKNSIKLTISMGVEVSVSPDVPAEKLIKIIELLKDL